MRERKALVHVGTHKTGTKTIQLFMSQNWEALREAGLFIPNAGRMKFDENNATPGHHALATALCNDDKTVLEEFRIEISNQDAPSIFISSEEFHPLVGNPAHLTELRDTITSLGYQSTAIVYLRPQAEYAQSMYAELSKAADMLRYDQFLRLIIEHGALFHDQPYRLIFEFSRLIRALAEIFGESNVVVRPYDDAGEPSALLTDFVGVVNAIGGSIQLPALALASPRVNRRGTFAEVLNGIYKTAFGRNTTALSTFAIAQRLGVDARDPRLGMPFSAMLHLERDAIRERFAADNRLVEAMTGVRIVDREIDANDPSWQIAEFQRRILDFAYDIWFK